MPHRSVLSIQALYTETLVAVVSLLFSHTLLDSLAMIKAAFLI